MNLENKKNNKLNIVLLEKEQEIKNICKSHYVKNLFVFGSILRSDFTEESDIDFLYEIDLENFEGWASGEYDYTDNLLSFENALSHLLNRKIDLIPNIIIHNKYLRREIEETKLQIYAA